MSATSTLNVNPTVTTTYVATFNDGTCTLTDSLHVTVNTNLLDLSVGRISTPVSCNMGTQSVAVVIHNTGVQTANFATTPLTVSLHTTGGAAPATTTATVNTGTLLSGDSLTVNVLANLSAVANQAYTYSLKAQLSIAGDQVPGNDTSITAYSVYSYVFKVNAGADQFIGLGDTATLSARTNQDRVNITEVLLSKVNAGAGLVLPTGFPATADEAIEIWNGSTGTLSLHNWTFNSYGSCRWPWWRSLHVHIYFWHQCHPGRKQHLAACARRGH